MTQLANVNVIRTKAVAATLELDDDYGVRIVPLRAPGVTYAVGDYVQPIEPTGIFYVAVQAGQSGTVQPRWHRDGQVRDGSVVWEPRPLGDAALPSISSAVWSSSGIGITISGQTQNGYRARALVAGGRLGEHYDVDVVVQVSTGAIMRKRYKLEIVA